MSEKFQDMLEQVNKDIIFQANEVEDALFKAVKSFKIQNEKMAEIVKKLDRTINFREVEIEKKILDLLATQQPVAIDLRFIVGALKMNNDLERMADHAKSIAKIALTLSNEPMISEAEGVIDLGKTTRLMVHDAVQSFIQRDSDLAKEVLERDNIVDEKFAKVTEIVYTAVEINPKKFKQGYEIINAAKHLERIADLATNLCEDVVFMNDATILRYGFYKQD